MSDRPHLLHLRIWQGEMSWRLESPYRPDDETRPCSMVEENMTRPAEPPEDRETLWTTLGYRTPTLIYEDTRERVTGQMLTAWTAYLAAEDEWEAWVPASGCFAANDLGHSGTWGEVMEGLDVENPSFPLKVRPEIEGDLDGAYVTALVLWEDPADG